MLSIIDLNIMILYFSNDSLCDNIGYMASFGSTSGSMDDALDIPGRLCSNYHVRRTCIFQEAMTRWSGTDL